MSTYVRSTTYELCILEGIVGGKTGGHPRPRQRTASSALLLSPSSLLLQPGSIEMWMLKLHEGRVAQILLLSYPSECYYTKYSKEKQSVQGRAHFLRIALLRGLVGYEIRRSCWCFLQFFLFRQYYLTWVFFGVTYFTV